MDVLSSMRRVQCGFEWHLHVHLHRIVSCVARIPLRFIRTALDVIGRRIVISLIKDTSVSAIVVCPGWIAGSVSVALARSRCIC